MAGVSLSRFDGLPKEVLEQIFLKIPFGDLRNFRNGMNPPPGQFRDVLEFVFSVQYEFTRLCAISPAAVDTVLRTRRRELRFREDGESLRGIIDRVRNRVKDGEFKAVKGEVDLDPTGPFHHDVVTSTFVEAVVFKLDPSSGRVYACAPLDHQRLTSRVRVWDADFNELADVEADVPSVPSTFSLNGDQFFWLRREKSNLYGFNLLCTQSIQPGNGARKEIGFSKYGSDGYGAPRLFSSAFFVLVLTNSHLTVFKSPSLSYYYREKISISEASLGGDQLYILNNYEILVWSVAFKKVVRKISYAESLEGVSTLNWPYVVTRMDAANFEKWKFASLGSGSTLNYHDMKVANNAFDLFDVWLTGSDGVTDWLIISDLGVPGSYKVFEIATSKVLGCIRIELGKEELKRVFIHDFKIVFVTYLWDNFKFCFRSFCYSS